MATHMPDLLKLADDLLVAGSLRTFNLSIERVGVPSDDGSQTVTIDATIVADPSTAPNFLNAKVVGPVTLTMNSAVQYGASSRPEVETTY